MHTTSGFMNGSWFPSGAFAALAGGFFIVILLFTIGMYIALCYVWYRIYRKAGTAKPWLAWIPVASIVPFFWTIKRSAWNCLWLFLPFVVASLGAMMRHSGLFALFAISYAAFLLFFVLFEIRFFKAFGINPHWLWLAFGLIMPGISTLVGLAYLVLLFLIAFNSNIHYRPDFDDKEPPGAGAGV